MKNYIFFILVTLSIIYLLSSCTEIIDVNINASNPQIVVEATIGTNEQPFVLITKTNDLNGSDQIQQVENAQVSISDNDGNVVNLYEIAPGQYLNPTSTFTGQIGKTYHLNILVEDKTISSTSTIPSFVPIDSVTVINSIYPGGGPPVGDQSASFYEVSIHYSDPENVINYYRILLFVNGLAQSGNHVYTDNFNNGKNVMQTLFMYNTKLKSGDIISIEMECIDKNVYNYF